MCLTWIVLLLQPHGVDIIILIPVLQINTLKPKKSSAKQSWILNLAAPVPGARQYCMLDLLWRSVFTVFILYLKDPQDLRLETYTVPRIFSKIVHMFNEI